MEGEFGEYHGYYGSKPSKKPVVNVKCITYRDDPILTGSLISIPMDENDVMWEISYSAIYWNHLGKLVPGVKGVRLEAAGNNLLVQIDNSYIGQVQQVAHAAWSLKSSNMIAKNIIVVDEDIDIYDPVKIFWALGTRVHPPRSIHQFPGVTFVTDPTIHPSQRVSIGETTYPITRLLIDATKPITNPRISDIWFGEKFAPPAYPDTKTMELIESRWKEYGIKA
jgi:4-hydroxy-3-polyprenylbenzoate decarboxylase